MMTSYLIQHRDNPRKFWGKITETDVNNNWVDRKFAIMYKPLDRTSGKVPLPLDGIWINAERESCEAINRSAASQLSPIRSGTGKTYEGRYRKSTPPRQRYSS